MRYIKLAAVVVAVGLMVEGTLAAKAPRRRAATRTAATQATDLVATSTMKPTTQQLADAKVLAGKLSSDVWAERQKAQEGLIKMGEAARPALEELVKQTQDPEARERAEAALDRIAENRSVGPSMVTLHLKDVPPQKVIEALEKQSFTTLPVWPPGLWKQQQQWKSVTIDIEQKPFWEAMKEVCEKTNLRPNSMGSDQRMTLMQGGDDSLMGKTVYSGPFMVVANSVTRSSTISYSHGNDQPSKSLYMQLSIYAEPKLNIIGHDYQVELDEAVDDKGNDLTTHDNSMSSMGQDHSARWSANVRLAMPENPGTKLARLRGKNRVLMQTRSQVWDVTDFTKPGTLPVEKVVGDRKYLIEEVKVDGGKENPRYHVKMTMTRQGAARALVGLGGQSWDQFGRGMRISLLDAKGKSLESQGYNGGGSDEKLTYTYEFAVPNGGGEDDDKVGPGVKIRVEVATDVKEVDVPFEFKDLPLP